MYITKHYAPIVIHCHGKDHKLQWERTNIKWAWPCNHPTHIPRCDSAIGCIWEPCQSLHGAEHNMQQLSTQATIRSHLWRIWEQEGSKAHNVKTVSTFKFQPSSTLYSSQFIQGYHAILVLPLFSAGVLSKSLKNPSLTNLKFLQKTSSESIFRELRRKFKEFIDKLLCKIRYNAILHVYRKLMQVHGRWVKSSSITNGLHPSDSPCSIDQYALGHTKEVPPKALLHRTQRFHMRVGSFRELSHATLDMWPTSKWWLQHHVFWHHSDRCRWADPTNSETLFLILSLNHSSKSSYFVLIKLAAQEQRHLLIEQDAFSNIFPEAPSAAEIQDMDDIDLTRMMKETPMPTNAFDLTISCGKLPEGFQFIVTSAKQSASSSTNKATTTTTTSTASTPSVDGT